MVMRYGKIKKHLRTIHVNQDLTIHELLLGVSLHFRKSFHVFPHFQLKDVSIFRPTLNPCLKLEQELAWRVLMGFTAQKNIFTPALCTEKIRICYKILQTHYICWTCNTMFYMSWDIVGYNNNIFKRYFLNGYIMVILKHEWNS